MQQRSGGSQTQVGHWEKIASLLSAPLTCCLFCHLKEYFSKSRLGRGRPDLELWKLIEETQCVFYNIEDTVVARFLFFFCPNFWAAKCFSRSQKTPSPVRVSGFKLFACCEELPHLIPHFVTYRSLFYSCLTCTFDLRIECLCYHHCGRRRKSLNATLSDLKHGWGYHQELLDTNSEPLEWLQSYQSL